MKSSFKIAVCLVAILLVSRVTVTHAALTDNLVAFWNLNETSGSRLDSVGSSTLATQGGAVSSAAGKVNTAAAFSGTTYLTTPDSAALSTGDIDFTLGGWVYLTSKSASQGIAMKYISSPDGNREYGLWYNSAADRFQFVVSSTGSTTAIQAVANNLGSPSLNTWYYVVGWHDSVGNTINIQVNNGTVDSTAHSAGVFDGAAPFVIGAINGASVLQGRVDALGLWKRLLTTQERTNLYNSGNGLEYPLSVNVIAPSAPAGLIIEPDDGQVALSWTTPSSDGGASITDYVIEYKLSTDGSWIPFSDGVSTATSATVTGLTNGSLYDFRISAVNSAGTGTASVVNKATPRVTALSTSLNVFYNLNESSGTRADSVGSNTLSQSGGTVSSAAGKVNNAAAFSGTSFLTTGGDSAVLSNADNDFTISGWVYLNNKDANQGIAMKYVSSPDGNREYGLFYRSSNDRLTFTVSPTGTTTGQVQLAADSLGSPSINTWYYVVGWHDSVNDTLNIQVNNGGINSQSYTGGAFDGTSPFAIGSYNAANVLTGRVDAVGMWKKVLTKSEKTALYNSGNGLEYAFSGNSITLSSPRTYQVFQRNGSNVGAISITGSYAGTPSAIEASWNGGPYATIVASPTGGTFSGTLSNQAGGQGTLTVRFVNDTATSVSREYVGVGDIYVIAGQSNASGRGTNNQTYISNGGLKASLFGNDDEWKELADPVDSATNQVDSVSSDAGIAAGTPWPLVTTQIIADQSVPVAFVPAAKGGSSIYQWQKNSSSSVLPTDTAAYSSCSASLNSTGLYGSMNRRIVAVGPVKAVLFFQGEQDARDTMATSRVSYEGYLNCFINNVYADYGVPTVTGMLNVYVGQATDTNIDTIRAAQKNVWRDNTHAIPGPVMVDTNVSDEGGDNVHFKTNTEIQRFATRWWAALKAAFYGGTDGRGPQIAAAMYNEAKTEVMLSFTDISGIANTAISPSVFTVKDNGTPVTVSAVERVSGSLLKLTLAAPASGTLTVSLASGSTGYAGTMPTDLSGFSLPAEPFANMETTLYVPDITAPIISAVTADPATNSAVISWTTDEASTTSVEYGSTTSYENTSTSVTLATSHTVTLTGLTSCSTYHYRVVSADATSNTATSADGVFTTAGCSPSGGGGGGGGGGGSSGTYTAPTVTPTAPTAPPSDCRPGDLFSGSTGKPCSGTVITTTTGTPVVPVAAFTRNLTLKSTGEDVRALQKYLNAKGFTVALVGSGSVGLETATFGPATKAALIKFQAANSIVPASGYFGPITRAFIAGSAPAAVLTTPDTSTTMTVISKIDLNVRALPSLQGEKLGSVLPGTVGTVLEATAEWNRMKFPAVEGWVYNAYLK